MSNNNNNNQRKNFSLLNRDEIKELGKIMSSPNRSFSNPISDTRTQHAKDHMVMGRDIENSQYKKEKDVDPASQGSFLSPTDEVNDATQNTDYAVEPPSAFSRLFAVKNLPLAHRITFGIGNDCFKSGSQFPFTFSVPKDAEVEKVEWSDQVTKSMRDIGFFRSGPQQMGIGEMDGEALLILLEEDFDWEKTDVSKPRDKSKPIVDTLSIPMYYVYRSHTIKEWTNEGLPRYWYININSLDGFSRHDAGTFKFHHTRIIHYNPDPLDTSTKGLCTLERAWQAICIGFNIDIGIGEAFFRWGIGHPVFETDFDSIEDLKVLMQNLGSPTRRTWHALLRGMKLTFAGAAGTALDFTSGKEVAVYDEVSIATGIPRPILKGEVAGVQTGSEVNERTYWSVLQQKQTAYNEVIWKLVAILNETGQIQVEGSSYNDESGVLHIPERVIVRWAVHYVETEEQRVNIQIKKLNALNPLKDLLTINEMRREVEDILNRPKGTFPDLPPPVGNQILSIYSDPFDLQQSLSEQQLAQANLPTEPKNKEKTTTKQGELKGTTPTEKLETFTGKGKVKSRPPVEKGIPKPPSGQKKPSPPKKTDSKVQDIRYSENKIVGCPNHEYYNRSCPACIEMLKSKEDMAYKLLMFGYTTSDVQRFLNLDRNKVNVIKQSIREKDLRDKNDKED